MKQYKCKRDFTETNSVKEELVLQTNGANSVIYFCSLIQNSAPEKPTGHWLVPLQSVRKQLRPEMMEEGVICERILLSAM